MMIAYAGMNPVTERFFIILLFIPPTFWVSVMASKKIMDICSDLEILQEDYTVPKRIRREAEETKKTLLDEKNPLDVRIASAISILDEVASDPNVPSHARTTLWSILSKLEGATQ